MSRLIISTAKTVDELRFWLHPALWGRGVRPFENDAKIRLELLGSETFDSGVVLLRYKPTGRH